MRHFKIMGLCLVAVFALVAVAAGSASAAEPEWGHCVAQKHGNYTDPNCTTVATKRGNPSHKGGFEWLGGGGASCYAMKHGNYADAGCTTVATKHGVPDHKGHFEKTGGGAFTSAGGAGVLEAHTYLCSHYHEASEFLGYIYEPHRCNRAYNGYYGPEEETQGNLPSEIECSSEAGKGEASGSKYVSNVKVKFSGCHYIGTPCGNTPATLGEIETNTLSGELGYYENEVTHTKKNVGVSLEPAAGKGHLFAKFVCTGNPTVEGYGPNGEPYYEEGLEDWVGEGSATQGYAWEPNPQGEEGGNDGILSPITPVNKMTSTFEQVYTSNTPGTQTPTTHNVPDHFEGGPFEGLESTIFGIGEAPYWTNSWGPAGQEIENTNTNTEGPGEIKA